MAAKQNFTIEQGATFKKRMIWRNKNGRPIDLTGYTAKMQLRTAASSSTSILDLLTSNSRITIDGTHGIIDLLVSATDTAALSVMTAVYDLILTSPTGTVTRLLEGKITITPGVSR